MIRRQLTLAGSHSLNHNIPRSLQVIARLGADFDHAASQRMPLAAISQGLASKPPAESLKVQWVDNRALARPRPGFHLRRTCFDTR